MPTSSAFNFNYWLTKTFLDNSRLTIFFILGLILTGVGSTFLMKTTGFPNPEIKLAIVQTVYAGAASETVAREVTAPLEGALKSVDGVEKFNSISSNNISIIRVNIKENANLDSVLSKLDSTLKSVDLPEGAQTPNIQRPSIAREDLTLAIFGDKQEDLYQISKEIEKEITELEQTAQIDQLVKLEKKVSIKLRKEKLLESGISPEQISSRILSLGENLPVAGDLKLDDTNTAIATTLNDAGLETLKNLEFVSTRPALPSSSSSSSSSNSNSSSNSSSSNNPSNNSNNQNQNNQTNQNIQNQGQNQENPEPAPNENETQSEAQTSLTSSESSQNNQSSNQAASVASSSDLSLASSTAFSSLVGENSEQSLDSGNQAPQGAVPTGQVYKLSDLAQISQEVAFEKDKRVNYVFKQDRQIRSLPAVFLQIKTVENTDQSQFVAQVREKIQDLNEKNQDKIVFAKNEEISEKYERGKIHVVEVYAVNDENQEQVQEVVGGLIGGPLKIDNQVLAQLGWLLGGIQLVVLAMIAFVSWRAALIAATAIPLSLLFSNIYLFLIGENLNTLVLFSLVLVIGLVVDPALVILEAIQRKIDAGLVGKEAVLAAVEDVGTGIFLATLTNIIVFAPFGLISGILGQIFAYIPATIVPATIGSYLVPLVCLAWLGGLILRPSAQAKKLLDQYRTLSPQEREKKLLALEEENLWGVAKFLINLNKKILYGPRLLRIFLIFLGLAISFGTVAYFSSTEQVRQVAFSSDDNADTLLLSGSFASKLPTPDRPQVLGQVLQEVALNKDVVNIYPYFLSNSGFSYQINIRNKQERSEKSREIAKRLTDNLEENFAQDFFDIKTEVVSTGPPDAPYQISIAIKTEDLEKAKIAATKIAQKMEELCKTRENTVKLDPYCDLGGESRIISKIDDGFSGRDNRLLEVVLDRQKLAQAQAVVPNAPLTGLVNQQIGQLFGYNRNEKIGNLNTNGEILPIYLETAEKIPSSKEEISNLNIFTLSGQSLKLSELAQIREVQPKQSINRFSGVTVSTVQARLNEENADNQNVSALSQNEILKFFNENDGEETKNLGLPAGAIGANEQGSTSDTLKSLGELGIALFVAIFVTYVVLALFFKSFSQPVSILYTIPLTLVGVYPGLAYLAGGQIGFLEIIGLIILVGIVENAAIFLVDAANQKIAEGWEPKEAIAFASGLRFRPVVLTTITAVASLTPLAIFSPFYRSIAVVIIFGLLTSGFASLISTPILFIFFTWLSQTFRRLKWYWQILFLLAFPLFILLFWLFGARMKVITFKKESRALNLNLS